MFVDEIESQKRITQALLNAQAENNVLLKEKEITTKFPIKTIEQLESLNNEIEMDDTRYVKYLAN